MKDKIHQQARATRYTTQIKEMKDKIHQQARATRYTTQDVYLVLHFLNLCGVPCCVGWGWGGGLCVVEGCGGWGEGGWVGLGGGGAENALVRACPICVCGGPAAGQRGRRRRRGRRASRTSCA